MTHDSIEEQVEALLQKANGRITRQRREVLHALLENHGPVTHAALQRLLPNHDRVSLYRALDWLSEEQIIEPLAAEDGVRRYIVHSADAAPHPHFVCENCGKTQCLHDVSLPTHALPPNYTISRISTVISGTCPECQPS